MGGTERSEDQSVCARWITPTGLPLLQTALQAGQDPQILLPLAVAASLPWHLLVLLNAGASVQWSSEQGESLLQVACQQGKGENLRDASVMRILLESGASLREIESCAHIAVQRNFPAGLQLALKAGADVFAPNPAGISLLGAALQSESFACVRVCVHRILRHGTPSDGDQLLRDVEAYGAGELATFVLQKVVPLSFWKKDLSRSRAVISSSVPQHFSTPLIFHVIRVALEVEPNSAASLMEAAAGVQQFWHCVRVRRGIEAVLDRCTWQQTAGEVVIEDLAARRIQAAWRARGE